MPAPIVDPTLTQLNSLGGGFPPNAQFQLGTYLNALAAGSGLTGSPNALVYLNGAGTNYLTSVDFVFSAAGGQLFINQTGALHGSSAGVQLSSLTANRAQYRCNQYGANVGVPGISTLKSRGATIGSLAPVQVGDVIFRDTAVGVTDNLSIPLSGLISIVVNAVPAGQGYIGTDFQVQLVPATGPANGRKEVFKVSGNGIVSYKEAVNSMAGVATLGAGGTVTVANTQVSATTRVMLTAQDGGSVPTGNQYLASRVVSTSFTIASTAGAGDAGVQVYYQLYEPAAP